MKLPAIFRKAVAEISTALTVQHNAPAPVQDADVVETTAFYGIPGYNNRFAPIYMVPFDGEKNLGETGPVYQYFLDYERLRFRSRQLFVESEIAQAVISKNTKWIVGGSLTLQAEPKTRILEKFGINIDAEAFNDDMEDLWSVYAKSKDADITGRKTLHELTSEACTEQYLVGDILVVLTVKGSTVKVRHIDAANVTTPIFCTYDGANYLAPNGNRIRHGVEIDDKGEHVAYWVRKDSAGIDYNRVLAYGKRSGMRMAYLCTRETFTVDTERGMPLMMAVIETAKKLERYTSAALAGAEDRQKVSMFIEHKEFSDNEDAFIARRAKANAGRGNLSADVAYTADGKALARDVQATTNTTTVNLPNGASIKAIDSEQETKVDEFGHFNIDLIAAAVDIPPDVVMSKYENSYSSSRMSGKDWEHTFLMRRERFADNYLGPIKRLQTYLWVLDGLVNAPGYLEAVRRDNTMVINSYEFGKWSGSKFPDIDPYKTVRFVREALGTAFAHVPLITPETGAELLGERGNIAAVIAQGEKNLDAADKAGMKPEEQKGPFERDDDGDGNPPEAS